MKSYELLAFMSLDLAQEILEFAFEYDKELYKVALKTVAENRKLRPIYLERKSRKERHVLMIKALCGPALDTVTSNIIRDWLIKGQKDMLVDFLGELGIEHKDGVVDELPESVETEKLKSAIDMLLGKYPPEKVTIYLYAFNEMEDSRWSNLAEILEDDSRLELGLTAA
jgi:hypothetical protein